MAEATRGETQVSGPPRSRSPEPAVDSLQIVDDLNRRHVLGFDFVDADDLDPVVEALLDGPYSDGRLPVVVTPNVDILVQLAEEANPVVTDVFEQARFCLPDGQPIVTASRILGQPLSARLPGSGLFERLWPRLVADDHEVVVIASNESIAASLAAGHQGAEVLVAPFIPLDDDQGFADLALSAIERAGHRRARFVISGIGHPKDVRIIGHLLANWPAEQGEPPLCLALGASLAMYTGEVKRAPEWVQRLGMEWFYRFCQEPRRLFHRYFVRDLAFVGMVRRARKRKGAGE